MTVGRKPTPTALKLVKGNPGKRALPKAEAVVALAEPTPPALIDGLERTLKRKTI